jgi:putative ABC transport system substrate-binding protein
VRRRRFVCGLAGLAAWFGQLGFPSAANAQPPASQQRIGVLLVGSAAMSSPNMTRFFQELARLGYVERINLKIEFRNAEDKPQLLPHMAQELVRWRPQVIFTVGTMESTVAAMKATSTIPIVFIHAVDPVRAGLVASLGSRGGNGTGVTSLNADLGGKRLELITEMVPGIRRAAVLVNPVDPETPPMLEALASAARAWHIQLDLLEIRDPAGLGGAVAGAAKGGAGALLVLGSPPLYRHSLSLAQLAAKHHLPTVSAWREFPDAGGLASYGTNIPAMFEGAARLVDRVLKGAKPAELPVEQPTKFELVVNLKTAKTLGIKIPESILLRADEVIR